MAVLLGIYWIVVAALRGTDLGMSLGFTGFLILMSATGVAALLFLVWWLALSRISRANACSFRAAIAGGAAAAFLEHKTAGGVLMFYGLPVAPDRSGDRRVGLRNSSSGRRTAAVAAVICLAWSSFLFVRRRDSTAPGSLRSAFAGAKRPRRFTWRSGPGKKSPRRPHSLRTSPPWSFSRVTGPASAAGIATASRMTSRIATNWNEKPPRLVWKRRIGPAWSSVAVVGNRLFTQEQLGDNEAVVCIDAATGETLWSHQDAVRHEDDQGGPVPRDADLRGRPHLRAGATRHPQLPGGGDGQAEVVSRPGRRRGDEGANLGDSPSSPLVTDDVVVVLACGDFAADNSIKAAAPIEPSRASRRGPPRRERSAILRHKWPRLATRRQSWPSAIAGCSRSIRLQASRYGTMPHRPAAREFRARGPTAGYGIEGCLV